MTSTDRPKCGAKTRGGGRCKHGAGERTNHPGQLRCWMHGGTKEGDKRLKHGKRSMVKRPKIAELQAQHLKNADPLNLLPELALARAFLQAFIERNEGKDQTLDVGPANQLIDTISKMVSRIETARTANAISRPELYRVIGEMGRVVDQLVPDPAVRAAIVKGWNAIAF